MEHNLKTTRSGAHHAGTGTEGGDCGREQVESESGATVDATDRFFAGASDPDTGPALDPTVLEDIASLQEPGESDVVADVIRTFLSTARSRLAQLKCSHHAGDGGAMAFNAHAMRGSAGIIGASRLVEQLRRLEHAALAEDADRISALMDDLTSEYFRVEAELQQFLQREASPL